jgi:hypothetical protein
MGVAGASREDGRPDATSLQSDTLFPSSHGLSFCVTGDTTSLTVTAAWGSYQRAPSATATTKTGEPKKVWKRRQMQGPVTIPLVEGRVKPQSPCNEQPDVTIRGQSAGATVTGSSRYS